MTKKKKILIIVLSIVGAIAIAVGVTLAVLLTRKPDKPPVKEGAIYQTESKIIWSGVAGVAYMSFEYIEEPETPEEGQLYGYVFKVMADGSTDVNKCTAWLSGKWELEENNGTYGTLKLTATWDNSNSDATKLTGATSGETKTYTLDGGVYKIGVSFSAGANLTFTLNPANKLSEGGTNKPNEPCTQHVDNNCDGVCDNEGCDETVAINHIDVKNNETQANGADGKCDKCGANMPTTAQVQLSLKDTKTSGQVTAYGKLELMTNNTWVISIAYVEGGDYTKTASGTWAMAQDYSKITLTVTEDTANALANDTYDMAVDASDTSNILYSVEMSTTIPQVGSLNFAFSNVPKVQATLTATSDGKYAKIELLDDNTWKLYMSYYAVENVPQGYTETASGTYALDASYNMVLTVTTDTADVLANDTYTLTVDYTTRLYSGTIHIKVTEASVDADFAFTQTAV